MAVRNGVVSRKSIWLILGYPGRASCVAGDNVSSPMTASLDPVRFILIALSGRMNSRQSLLIDYLREENRVLREQLGDKRLRFTDDQRRRLAVSLVRAKGPRLILGCTPRVVHSDFRTLRDRV